MTLVTKRWGGDTQEGGKIPRKERRYPGRVGWRYPGTGSYPGMRDYTQEVGKIPSIGGDTQESAQEGGIPRKGWGRYPGRGDTQVRVAIPSKGGVIPRKGGSGYPGRGDTQERAVIPSKGGVIPRRGEADIQQGGGYPSKSGDTQ